MPSHTSHKSNSKRPIQLTHISKKQFLKKYIKNTFRSPRIAPQNFQNSQNEKYLKTNQMGTLFHLLSRLTKPERLVIVPSVSEDEVESLEEFVDGVIVVVTNVVGVGSASTPPRL